MNKTCTDIAKLLDFSIHDDIEKVLSVIFSSSRDRKIYELTDGTRSSRNIGKIIGLDQKEFRTFG